MFWFCWLYLISLYSIWYLQCLCVMRKVKYHTVIPVWYIFMLIISDLIQTLLVLTGDFNLKVFKIFCFLLKRSFRFNTWIFVKSWLKQWEYQILKQWEYQIKEAVFEIFLCLKFFFVWIFFFVSSLNLWLKIAVC